MITMGQAWEMQVDLPQNIWMLTLKTAYVSPISALISVEETQKGRLERGPQSHTFIRDHKCNGLFIFHILKCW